MSQKVIFDILKECGGKATVVKIREKAKEKEPFTYLSVTVNKRLRQLERNGFVKFDLKSNEWKII